MVGMGMRVTRHTTESQCIAESARPAQAQPGALNMGRGYEDTVGGRIGEEGGRGTGGREARHLLHNASDRSDQLAIELERAVTPHVPCIGSNHIPRCHNLGCSTSFPILHCCLAPQIHCSAPVFPPGSVCSLVLVLGPPCTNWSLGSWMRFTLDVHPHSEVGMDGFSQSPLWPKVQQRIQLYPLLWQWTGTLTALHTRRA